LKRDELRARLLATFHGEAEEHLQVITKNLLAFEAGLPADEQARAVEETFREVHTLKGAARSVSLTDVESLCQACESVLSRVKSGGLGLGREVLERLRAAIDSVGRLLAGDHAAAAVGELLGRLEGISRVPHVGSAPPSPRPTTPAEAPAAHGLPPPDTLRVATAKLDALLLGAEELLFPELAGAERVREATALLEAVTGCRRALDRTVRAAHGNGHASEAESDLGAALRVVETQARDLLGRLVRDHRTLAVMVDGLESEARRLRMSAASTILGPFPGMVRDLAGQQGKDVEWVVRGADLEVDRKVLESMKEPLIHLVRNAVDHGTEPPAERTAAGKSPRGRITVAFAPLEGERVEIRVEDDGRGVDPVRVREAGVRSRLVTSEEAEDLTDEQALELVYRSGLSTSPMITNVSGHGLGLAIVKERVERLGGHVRVESRAGAGTSVRMTLPATIATFRGLLVAAGRGLFLLPRQSVERAIRIADEQVRSVEGRETIVWDRQSLTLARLSGLLELPEQDEPAAGSRRPCLILGSPDARMALRVDRILGDREVLVKELRSPLVRVRNVSGAGLLGTGEVALILRPSDLLRSARRAVRPTAVAPGPQEKVRPPTVLVVDDSITTRTMEKNLLEAAGYQVLVAVDGVEAWTALKSEKVDLVVSDVDMPRMDGFELTRRIREDRELADLPVVLVTALESREDKERGVDVGANAYVVKSSFDQSNLLEIIRRLV
jgi:two-component system, chemotaxis family, sensor kinase CheA